MTTHLQNGRKGGDEDHDDWAADGIFSRYCAVHDVYGAGGTPIYIYAVFNYKYVAAELIYTIVGSFGLVLLTPLTAAASGIFLTSKKIGEDRTVPEQQTEI